ncbi:DUF302 domain-containing protein [Candidatus Albibeggiatoa sp. nov. BB20]|uniref:DUF302 domain-containing protein n=1 Tax=Candidatus Albibeggiatoa sp. nov. BB20 TaxID=3162723 RepID=UPI0033654CD6
MIEKLKQIPQLYQTAKLYWHCYQPPIIWRYLQYFFISFGVVSFSSLLFLYFLGYQAVQSFDNQFPYVFKQFIQTSLVEDVPSALILKYPLAKGVSLAQAEKSLLLAAKQNQLTLIHTELLDKILSTEQIKWKLKIFSLLSITASQKLLQQYPYFAAHLPFHIVLYQDLQGQAWVAMPNIALLIHGLKYDSTLYQLDVLTAYEAMFKTLMASVYGIEEE